MDRERHRAGRPRRALGTEHLGVGRRRTGRPHRRRGHRPAQHPLQGPRSGVHPGEERCPRARDGERLPRHRLRRPAARGRRRRARAPGTRHDRRAARRCARGDAVRRSVRGPRRRHRRGGGRRPCGRGRTRGPLRPPLHLRHDRRAQGCDDDARTEPAGVQRLGRRRRAAQRRPVPRREPVLPLVRLQGRDPRRADDWRDAPAPRGVRRERGAGAHPARSDLDGARAAVALPGDPRAP